MRFKRLVLIFSVFIFTFNISISATSTTTGTAVSTDTTATNTSETGGNTSAYKLFNYYSNKRSIGDLTAIDLRELYIFGIYLSNFLVPFDKGVKGSYDLFKTEEGRALLDLGQPDNSQDYSNLFEKLNNYRYSASIPLITGTGSVATLGDLLKSYKDSTAYVIKTNAGIATITEQVVFDKAKKLSSLSLATAINTNTVGFSELVDGSLTAVLPLMLDGFGNIYTTVSGKDIVVIQAVINPYIYSSFGDKLFFTNNIFLYNYVDIASSVQSVKIQESEDMLSYFGTIGADNKALINDIVINTFYPSLFVGEASTAKTESSESVVSIMSKPSKPLLSITALSNIRDKVKDKVDGLSFTLVQEPSLITPTENKTDIVNKKVLPYLNSVVDDTSRSFTLNTLRSNNITEDVNGARKKTLLWSTKTDLGKALDKIVESSNSISMTEGNLYTDLYQFDLTNGGSKAIGLFKKVIPNKSYITAYINNQTKVETAVAAKMGSLNTDIFLNNYVLKYAFSLLTMNTEIYRYINATSEFMKATDGTDLKIKNLVSTDNGFIVHLYYTLLQAMLTTDNSTSFMNQDLYTLLNKKAEVTDSSLSSVEKAFRAATLEKNDGPSSKEMVEKIYTDTYKYLTDPGYRSKMLQEDTTNFFIREHYKVSGGTMNKLAISNSSEGYSGFASITYLTKVKDLPIIGFLDSSYIVTVLVIMLIVLTVIMLVLRYPDFKSVFKGTFFAAIMLIVPLLILNVSADYLNKKGTELFTDKFGYWATTQFQQYLLDISSAKSETDTLVTSNLDLLKQSGDMGVVLKWLSPKKLDLFDAIFNKETTIGGVKQTVNLSIFKWLGSGVLRQEFYVKGIKDAAYLNRGFHDIARAARDGYNNFSTASKKITTITNESNEMFAYKELNTPEAKTHRVAYKSNPKHATAFLLSSESGNESVSIDELKNLIISSSQLSDTVSGNANPNASYLHYTESVFYYFYDVFRDYESTGEIPGFDLENNEAISSGFSNVLLTATNSNDSAFINTIPDSASYGRLKDFLDLEGLFTNVYPYLILQNDIADDLNTTASSEAAELQAWLRFSNWADIISQTSLNKSGSYAYSTIYDDKRIQNRLNPKEYELRPMIFSPAQQEEEFVSSGDLTLAEQKMQTVLTNTYEDILYLTNNIGYADENLLVMSAMIATFNFNKEFSETGLFESKELLPQGFELKGFSYDSFNKLMLVTASGEPAVDAVDIYYTVLSKLDIVSSVLLLVNDYLGVYIIPYMRVGVMLLLLVLAFVMALQLILYKSGSVLSNLKVILQSLLAYGIFNLGYLFLLSTLFAEGLTDIVGTKGVVIALNSPTVLFLVLLILNGVLISGHFFILRMYVKEIADRSNTFKYALNSINDFTSSFVSKSSSTIGGVIGGGAKNLGGFVGNGVASTFVNTTGITGLSSDKTLSRIERESNIKTNRASKKETEMNNKYNAMIAKDERKREKEKERQSEEETISNETDTTDDV